MPRTVITGGAGFVGSHLCDRFLAEGHEVACVDNCITGSAANVEHLRQNQRFTLLEHDISRPLEIEGEVTNILHFASPASPVDYLRYPIPTLKVGSLGTHNGLGLAKLKNAGFRGQNPLTKFLFFRLILPFVGFALAAAYLFALGGLPEQTPMVRFFVCIVVAYGGFYAPLLYVSNRAAKRKKSIQLAWPDALDLMLICVESGMSVEAAFRKVSEEIGSQSVELAGEFVLTNAELSFLQERRAAYDNLAGRTGLESVRSVTQALIQAERYGTPVAMALRVLAQESRDMRMNEAEKKAAALPPKLTVPMILFFVPVLFAVILGPAIMQAMALKNGG